LNFLDRVTRGQKIQTDPLRQNLLLYLGEPGPMRRGMLQNSPALTMPVAAINLRRFIGSSNGRGR
jgi:hypothetical protein